MSNAGGVALLVAAGEQEDFRPLFAHPKTGHLLAWVHQEPTFWGGALLLTAEFVSVPWPVRAGDARRPVFLLLACCTQEDDEGGPMEYS